MRVQTGSLDQYYQVNCNNSRIEIGGEIISRPRILIGSSRNCDVVIHDSSVSAIHAVLEISNNKLRLYDMNTTHGTFVGDKKVIAEYVSLNEKVRLGHVEISFSEFDPNKMKKKEFGLLAPGLPPVITDKESVAELSESIEEVKARQLPQKPIAFKGHNNISSIVYPLAGDANAEFSEYIFEDLDTLYPIFQYDVNKAAVEVVILYQDRVFSVDYLPDKPGTYFFKGKESNNPNDVFFPHLGKEEKYPFIEIQNNKINITQPVGYEAMYLGNEEQSKKTNLSYSWEIKGNDILRFHREDVQIYIRSSDAPPQVARAPFFRRDKDLKRYILLMLLLVGLFYSAMIFYTVDKEEEKEKNPERIATILYRQKLASSKVPTVMTKKKPEVTAKSQNEIKKVKKEEIPKREVKKVEKKVTKVPKKTAKPTVKPKADVAKKVEKSSPVKKVVKSTAPKVGGKSKKVVSKDRPSRRRFKSKGNVDTYKSANFKSTINNLMAKGSSTSGVRARADNDSDPGNTEFSSGGAEQGRLRRAEVTKDVGSLTGSTLGRLNESSSAQGLVDKKTVITAGIPSQTVILGSMDPEIIRRILREHIPQFRHCYQRALDRSTREFSGTVRLDFSIGNSGTVTKAGIGPGSNMPPRVRRCVTRVLRGIKFPPPLGGGTVDVEQPINFYANVR